MSRRKEQGVALIVALVLLVVVTLLGVSGVQNVALEEKMAAAAFDRNLALQAAEAALRMGEAVAEAQSKTVPPNSGFPSYTDANNTCPASPSAINNCVNGLCPTPDKDCNERWKVPNFTGWVDAPVNLGSLAGTPQYFIEYLGNTFPCTDGGPSDPKNCKRYRITARSNPGTERATVMLQSIYATD
ncbi:pilus assembly PilX family protein [Hydrogenophilus thiooxidans]|uniref:pilus assembly PilX family protein n=1 Tax=Hydrogenophilus thiooxidans TaxID=2820326 RepID=UPI001C220141|nr:pilus assembly protein [Hydrogenophilus thiooxidans]